MSIENPRGRIAAAGFTLVEAAVILAMIAIISGAILSSFPTLKQQVIFQRSARELAATLRQMQNKALVVGRIQVGGVTQTPRRVGIVFDLQNSNADYYFFADRNNNGSYDGNYSNSCGSADPGGNQDCIFNTGTLPRGITISDICFNIDSGADCGQNRLDITFKSPAASMDLGNANRVSAKLILSSSSLTGQRSVKAYTSGQIASQAE